MILRKFFKNPVYYLHTIKAYVSGTLYVVYYRITKRNVKIGFPFLAYGKVKIIGPGSVSIGKKCAVAENVFRGLTIVTLSKDASVTIGNRGCLLAGLTIRCYKRVSIGDDLMTAISLVQDTLFVNKKEAEFKIRHKQDILQSESVDIGNNVWLGARSCVLGGSRIGNDCVLAACSLCCRITIKNYSLGSGNPVKRALPIEQLLALRK